MAAVVSDNQQPDHAATARTVRDQLPDGGLFADQHWRVAVEPFRLGAKLAKDLDSLGRVLLQFYRAVNLLYRQSAEGRVAPWVATLLDQGKPPHVVELQRSPAFRAEVPRVIRPDILLTEEGMSITELDSVPGGIGLTAWLNRAYAPAPVLGGAEGMISGFESIFADAPQVHIVVADEAATYRPEMEWLCDQLTAGRFSVQSPDFTHFHDGDAVYRFFEMFDLPNVPAAEVILAAAMEKRIQLTPPPKPVFEEKALAALLWNHNLREFWRQHLGESFLRRMQSVTPYSWIVDPAPLPPHASYPGLNITDWQQLKTLSQRERDLILKVSGFSPEAWGARGVYLGSDLSLPEWSAAVDKAINSFDTTPYVLQRYHKPRTVESRWYDFDASEVRAMQGRVRLCPYYFVQGEGDAARPHLSGVLATICPADKKIIHGMKDAILAPCME